MVKLRLLFIPKQKLKLEQNFFIIIWEISNKNFRVNWDRLQRYYKNFPT